MTFTAMFEIERQQQGRRALGASPAAVYSVCFLSLHYPHSENPHTWHFTQPSANSSCEPQSGHVPMNDCVYPLMSNPSCSGSEALAEPAGPSGAPATGFVICSSAGTPA